MKKEKLKQVRIARGISQDQMAELICRDKSAYCRKEKGEVKITMSEWEKIAKFLNVAVEEIYESDTSDGAPAHITEQNYSVPMAFVEHLHDYIRMLKKEITELKKALHPDSDY